LREITLSRGRQPTMSNASTGCRVCPPGCWSTKLLVKHHTFERLLPVSPQHSFRSRFSRRHTMDRYLVRLRSACLVARGPRPLRRPRVAVPFSITGKTSAGTPRLRAGRPTPRFPDIGARPN
jgi:hypothetical protein